MTIRQIKCAVRGYRVRKREEWEMVRVLSAYTLAPHSRKVIRWKDITLPIDKEEEIVTHGKRQKLTRDEVKRLYERSGFEVTDEFLERIAK